MLERIIAQLQEGILTGQLARKDKETNKLIDKLGKRDNIEPQEQINRTYKPNFANVSRETKCDTATQTKL